MCTFFFLFFSIMQKVFGIHLLQFHCNSVWLEGKYGYFLKEHILKLRHKLCYYPRIKEHAYRPLHSVSPTGNTDLPCLATDLSLCYDSLDSIIRIAVHYDLLSLNCLLRIQPNVKRREKKEKHYLITLHLKGMVTVHVT